MQLPKVMLMMLTSLLAIVITPTQEIMGFLLDYLILIIVEQQIILMEQATLIEPLRMKL